MTFLLPVTALVYRELVRSLRRIRPFLLLAAALLVPVFIVSELWPGDRSQIMRAARASREIVNVISVYLVVMVGVLLPGYASTAILQEREQRTYELMSLTLIGPLGIVVGKVLNAVGFLVLIMVACAPIIATVFFLIGIEWASLAYAGAVLAAATVTCAAIGVLCSAYVRRVIPAVIMSYAATFTLMGGPLYFLMIVGEIAQTRGLRSYMRALSTYVFDLGRIVCPIHTMVEMVEGHAEIALLLKALGYQGCVLILCVTLAWIRLRKTYEPPVEAAQRKRGMRGFVRWVLLGNPNRRPYTIADHPNPVCAQEMHWGPLTNRSARWRMFIALTLLTLVVMSPIALEATLRGGNDFPAIAFVILQFIIIGMISPAIAANSVTKEYERNNMDMLRMTLLTPSKIVFGKWKAGVLALAPAFAAAVASWLLLLPWISRTHQAEAALYPGFGTLVVAGMLSVSLGLLASSIARQTIVAVVVSYFLCACFYFGFPASVKIGSELFRELFGVRIPGNLEDALFDVACYLSPFATYIRHIEDSRWDADETFVYWSNLVFHAILSVGLVYAVSLLFGWLHMRDTRLGDAVLRVLRFRRRTQA